MRRSKPTRHALETKMILLFNQGLSAYAISKKLNQAQYYTPRLQRKWVRKNVIQYMARNELRPVKTKNKDVDIFGRPNVYFQSE